MKIEIADAYLPHKAFIETIPQRMVRGEGDVL